MGEEAVLVLCRSIDANLADLRREVAAMREMLVTQADCTNCRKRWLPRSYVLGVGAAFGVVSVMIAFARDILDVFGGTVK